MWQYDKKTDRYYPGMVPPEGQITACYDRLSQEDEAAGDSDSILNQRALLLKYCTDHHFQNIRFFSDESGILGPSQKVLKKEAFF